MAVVIFDRLRLAVGSRFLGDCMRALRCWFLSLVASTFAFSPISKAAEVTTIPGSNGGPSVIVVRGDLAKDDDKIFANVALAQSSAVVLFSSNGGLLLPGIEIGKAIRLKGFATVVPDGFQCASACALAWLAGSPRFLSSKGRVGFHAAYLESDGRLMPNAVGNALVGAYLNQLNLSSSAVIYITSAPPEDMRWMNVEDALRIGIDVRRFDPSASVKPNESASAAVPTIPSQPVRTLPTNAPTQATSAPLANSRPVQFPPGKFADFASSAAFTGNRVDPLLDTPLKWSYRTRPWTHNVSGAA
ncbi:MAG: hypothetical protein K2P80_07560 [Beijerinckiaceae bacterium]|nr:hypothetical protein [Beijerinckiaceae bacterium]